MKTLIVYVYFMSPSSDYNLSFFSKIELTYKPDIDYIIVINGHRCSVNLPIRENVTVLKRDNIGFDFGGHAHALEHIQHQNKTYDYYFFMNSGVIGPIIPYYHKAHWSHIFIKKLNDKVKLVGTTIACLPASDLGGYGPKVEGFFFLTDKIGLDLLQKEKTIFCNHDDKTLAIVNGEYGLSNCILRNGYSIDCMLKRYNNIDWNDKNNWNMNNNKHPSRKNSFFNNSINPYEVIFHKWFWHGSEYVNFDIIKNYVNYVNNYHKINNNKKNYVNYVNNYHKINNNKKNYVNNYHKINNNK